MARKKAHKRKKTKKSVASSTSQANQATVQAKPKVIKTSTPEPRTGLFDSTQTLILLIVAGAMIIFALFLVAQATWASTTDPVLSTEESTFSPVPLPGVADPNQLQSGNTPLQNGSVPGASEPSAGESLQPQQSVSPEELDKLQ